MGLFLLVSFIGLLGQSIWLEWLYPDEDMPLVRWVGLVALVVVGVLIQAVLGADDMALSEGIV